MASLNEMKIGLQGLGNALKEYHLVVPRYQRSYKWEERHISDLFQDLASAINDDDQEYFLGSIVVAKSAGDTPEVVDGQQRLATTKILIAAIRDYFCTKKDMNRAHLIESTYLMAEDLRSGDAMPKLKLNGQDHEFFRKRILLRPGTADRIKLEGVAPLKHSHQRIARAAELAKKRVELITNGQNKPVDLLLDWIEFIKDKAKVIWFRLPDYANAFTIFETLNDRGLELASADLVKNYLFSLSGDALDEIEGFWTRMYGALEVLEDEEIVVDYIRQLWSSTHGLTREKQLFSKIKGEVATKRKAVEFAEELALGAKTFAAIVNPGPAQPTWKKFGVTAMAHMQTLNFLGITRIRPLIMAVFDKFKPEEARVALQYMVSWGVRFTVVGTLGIGTLEEKYSELAKDISDENLKTSAELKRRMLGIVPGDVEFHTAFAKLSVTKASFARYYLRALELKIASNKNPELIPNPNEEEVNLEHILPQSPSADWTGMAPDVMADYSKRLGNLAILGKEANEVIGNQGFGDKRKVYLKSAFKITKSVASKKVWSSAEIDSRQVELADLAVKTWPRSG